MLLKHCTLILINLNRQDELQLCHSCRVCQQLINKYKIRRVIVYYNIVDDNHNNMPYQ
jgi:hypothetical protein